MSCSRKTALNINERRRASYGSMVIFMKKFIVFLLTASLTAALAGCSFADSSAADAAPKSTAPAATEALLENQSQIAGTVTSIVGNEVVLALGEIKERTAPDGKMSEDSHSADSSTENTESSADSKATQGRGQGGFSGKMPSGERPSGDMPSGKMPSGNFGGGMSGSAEITPTGETGTYLIPVGLSLSGTSGSVADFSAITEGMTLRLTLEADSDGTQRIVAAEVLAQ